MPREAHPNSWQNSPIVRIGRHDPLIGPLLKCWFSAVFQFWHGFCTVMGMKRDHPASHKITRRSHTMFATETRTNLFAAVFSVAVSAVLYAAAIVPASPGLVA